MNGSVVTLHHEAMTLASEAFIVRMQGEIDRANNLTREAFIKEKEAANLIANNFDLEPSRSVLHRSAASLALECSELREAEKLIAVALSGEPPQEIANELRDLLEQVYFQRHLDLRGIQLSSNEFQISLAGDSVGLGLVPNHEFASRIESLEKLIYGTAERKKDKPFRKGGNPTKELSEEVEVYISTPRAASFAVSFRLGNQLSFPGLGLSEQVIDEIFYALKLFNDSNFEEIKKIILDNDYYQNFVGLARNIAPDGNNINMVGFTAIRNNYEERLIMSTPRSKSLMLIDGTAAEVKKGERSLEDNFEIKGKLKFADSTKTDGFIKVISIEGEAYKIKVPIGMMGDVVRPLYEENVMVRGVVKGKIKELVTIDSIK
jgi:hypothetical protein